MRLLTAGTLLAVLTAVVVLSSGVASEDLGAPVRDEDLYKTLHPPEQREYYEDGDSTWGDADLTGPSEKAAKYEGMQGGVPQYGDDYPRKPDESIDHSQVMKNVKAWVDDTLEPDDDPADTQAFKTSDIIAKFGGVGNLEPGNDVDPNGDGKGAWICIDHAFLMAYTMRALGYPVREKNIPLSEPTDEGEEEFTYQEAAINVWFEGEWHYADPYLCSFDPDDLLNDFTDYKINRVVGPPDWNNFGVYDRSTGEQDPSDNWDSTGQRKQRDGFAIVDDDVDMVIMLIDGLMQRVGNDGSNIYDEVPFSRYVEDMKPIYLNHRNTVPVDSIRENIFVSWSDDPDSVPEYGTYNYTLRLTNISADSIDFHIEVTPYEWRLEIHTVPEVIDGALGPFSAEEFGLEVSFIEAPGSGMIQPEYGRFGLAQNYPNPFIPTTEIGYGIRASCHVTLTVYNVLGQEIARLVDGYQTAGQKSIRWDGKDNNGRRVESGVYFYRLTAGNMVDTKKMVVMR